MGCMDVWELESGKRGGGTNTRVLLSTDSYSRKAKVFLSLEPHKISGQQTLFSPVHRGGSWGLGS